MGGVLGTGLDRDEVRADVAGGDELAVDVAAPHLAAEQPWFEPGLAGAVGGEDVDGRVPVGQGEEVGDVGGTQRAHS